MQRISGEQKDEAEQIELKNGKKIDKELFNSIMDKLIEVDDLNLWIFMHYYYADPDTHLKGPNGPTMPFNANNFQKMGFLTSDYNIDETVEGVVESVVVQNGSQYHVNDPRKPEANDSIEPMTIESSKQDQNSFLAKFNSKPVQNLRFFSLAALGVVGVGLAIDAFVKKNCP